eukprot:764512-Hanusia_phi.AAC.4
MVVGEEGPRTSVSSSSPPSSRGRAVEPAAKGLEPPVPLPIHRAQARNPPPRPLLGADFSRPLSLTVALQRVRLLGHRPPALPAARLCPLPCSPLGSWPTAGWARGQQRTRTRTRTRRGISREVAGNKEDEDK